MKYLIINSEKSDNKNKLLFGDLEVGDIFFMKHFVEAEPISPYMKICPVPDEQLQDDNAIDLTKGECVRFWNDAEVGVYTDSVTFKRNKIKWEKE